MTPINITNAFKKCGIYPYDDSIVTDEDFLPSTVTDRPDPGRNKSNEDRDTDEDRKSPSILNDVVLTQIPAISKVTQPVELPQVSEIPEKHSLPK